MPFIVKSRSNKTQNNWENGKFEVLGGGGGGGYWLGVLSVLKKYADEFGDDNVSWLS